LHIFVKQMGILSSLVLTRWMTRYGYYEIIECGTFKEFEWVERCLQ